MILGRRELLFGGLGSAAVGAFALQSRALVPFTQTSVDPESFGAIGDGQTDDLPALMAAFAEAGRSGQPVDGGDRIFGLRGSLHIKAASRPQLRSLRLRQLAPANGVSTLHFEDCMGVDIDRLEIDAGQSRRSGDANSTFGLWIEGGVNHDINNVVVHGHGKYSLIGIWNTAASSYTNLTARDAAFDDPAAADDVLQGIWLYRNRNCVLRDATVMNLTGNASYVGRRFANLRSRGIVLGGNQRVAILNPTVRNVDQGIDLTGSDGNLRCVIEGGESSECGSVGVKFANSAVDCRVSRHIATRCGMYGFMASGPAEANLPHKTQDCDFIDCTSIDVGFNRIAFPDPSGFIIRRGDYDLDYPQGIRFIRCRAVDRQPAKTMKYGFFSDVPSGRKSNRLIECTSEGHGRAAQAGAWSNG